MTTDPQQAGRPAGDWIRDQYCPNSRDGSGHCQHWWDGEAACCWCGSNDPPADQDVELQEAEVCR